MLSIRYRKRTSYAVNRDIGGRQNSTLERLDFSWYPDRDSYEIRFGQPVAAIVRWLDQYQVSSVKSLELFFPKGMRSTLRFGSGIRSQNGPLRRNQADG